MTAIKEYKFPLRLTAGQLPGIYKSAEEAFSAYDFIYAARYADTAELRGCALLMLGNRVGGNRVLDKDNVQTPRACFYRAYAAWQDDDAAEASRWVAEARAAGSGDLRLDLLTTLMDRRSFKVLFHWDVHNVRLLEPFKALPDIEVAVTRQFPVEGPRKLSFGQPLHEALPDGFTPDLIILDDLKMVPVGIGDVGAPVVALIHDIEWYYDLLPHIVPEIDMLSVAATSEMVEAGRAFGVFAATCLFPAHLSLPEFSVSETLQDLTSRTVDLFYSGSLRHDFYRFKKQSVLPLMQLGKKFNIEIEDKFYPLDVLWQKKRQSRFTLMTSRNCNYLATRAIESVACGAIHLTEEEDGMPYLFSERFDCFQIYRRDHIVADVENHLRHYDRLIRAFKMQLPQFEAEFRSVLPLNAKKRAQRYLRYVLFMTYVEGARRRPGVNTDRQTVYLNEYDRLKGKLVDVVARFREQALCQSPLRRAFAERSFAGAQEKSAEETGRIFAKVLEQGLKDEPKSLALHHALGISQMQLEELDEAEQTFAKMTAGGLHLSEDDPPPVDLGRLNSFYWVNDARIRARCPETATALVSPEQIYISYAWANRADIALRRKNFKDAADYANRSLSIFSYNEDVQRLYLHALLGLASGGDKQAEQEYHEAFQVACRNDYSILDDFSKL